MQKDPRVSRTEAVLALLVQFALPISDVLETAVADKVLGTNAAFGTLIALHQESSLRPAQIAELTGLTSGGVTKMLDRMEKQGLVVRTSGSVPGDRRAVVVTLTDSGVAVFGRVMEAAEPSIDRLLEHLIDLRQAVQVDPA